MDLYRAIDQLGGIAKKSELLAMGVSLDQLLVSAWYGWTLMRVRNGWFARVGERPDVIRAWRVGGRLTCVSAIAFHEGLAAGPALHVEVPGNAAGLRDPDNRRARLTPDAAVVLHWARHRSPGGRRAVDLEHAVAQAASCGVHAGPVRRAQAARSTASKIV